MLGKVSIPGPSEVIERTGLYCEICKETWHERYAHRCGDVWHVPSGSKAAFYEVFRAELGGWRCTCAGFEHRQRCKHVVLVYELEGAGKTDELSHATKLRYEQQRWPDDILLSEL